MTIPLAPAANSLWAKLQRRRSPASWHPLICHMLDVAAVAEALWRTHCSPPTRAWIAHALSLPLDVTGAWVAFIAGLHDLGKAGPIFHLAVEAGAGRVRAAGLVSPLPQPERRVQAPHATVTQATLAAALQTVATIPEPVLSRLAEVLGGHHGAFPLPGQAAILSTDPGLVGGAGWRAAREHLVVELARALSVPLEQPPTCPPDLAASLWLAGLVSVADWIGSDTRFFPLAGAAEDTAAPQPVDAYLPTARAAAARALHDLGWSAWLAAPTVRSFTTLFPHLPEPRPLQRAGDAIATHFAAPRPWLAIIEAPMGEGKTELVLHLGDRWRVEGLHGAYVALPTQASSNQMFGRVRDFLARVYPAEVVNLHLLHGHADLSAELQQLRSTWRLLLDPQGIGDDVPTPAGPGAVVAAEWFTRKKHGLLARYGVGTIDQLLLSVLQTRHGFVRLFGVAGKTVVIDEVHAFDTYMSTLLERLLEWLAALGSAVLLLSATLPAARRNRLLEAYARGAAARPVPADTPIVSNGANGRAAYPRITLSDGHSVRAISVAPSADVRRTVRLRWVDLDPPPLGLDSPPGAAPCFSEELLGALEGGGCAAVICNTVQRAQQTYAALRRALASRPPGWCDLDLLHARFPFNRRAERERRALDAFGKAPDALRPARAIMVATQIVEQSLDLDFDLMVSDFAPLDLLLQRLGRLHRHRRSRPAALSQPTLWLGRPPTEGDLPRFERGAVGIYGRHTLLRSWLALTRRVDGEVLRLPDEIEPLVEAVYDERPCPGDESAAVATLWAETWAELQAERRCEEQEAKDRWLKAPTARERHLHAMLPQPREEDTPELHPAHQALTRLIEPNVRVVLLWRRDSALWLDPVGSAPAPIDRVPTLPEAEQLQAHDEADDVAADGAAIAIPAPVARVDIRIGAAPVGAEWAAADQGAADRPQLDPGAGDDLLDGMRALDLIGVDASGQGGHGAPPRSRIRPPARRVRWCPRGRVAARGGSATGDAAPSARPAAGSGSTAGRGPRAVA